ncbi:MAG: hypothetical protein KAW12_29570 [Candidatus Aminicenantes bacterium]|nr:hypothetical protein [Candidatus Aminicenantes bacterium]
MKLTVFNDFRNFFVPKKVYCSPIGRIKDADYVKQKRRKDFWGGEIIFIGEKRTPISGVTTFDKEHMKTVKIDYFGFEWPPKPSSSGSEERHFCGISLIGNSNRRLNDCDINFNKGEKLLTWQYQKTSTRLSWAVSDVSYIDGYRRSDLKTQLFVDSSIGIKKKKGVIDYLKSLGIGDLGLKWKPLEIPHICGISFIGSYYGTLNPLVIEEAPVPDSNATRLTLKWRNGIPTPDVDVSGLAFNASYKSKSLYLQTKKIGLVCSPDNVNVTIGPN